MTEYALFCNRYGIDMEDLCLISNKTSSKIISFNQMQYSQCIEIKMKYNILFNQAIIKPILPP